MVEAWVSAAAGGSATGASSARAEPAGVTLAAWKGSWAGGRFRGGLEWVVGHGRFRGCLEGRAGRGRFRGGARLFGWHRFGVPPGFRLLGGQGGDLGVQDGLAAQPGLVGRLAAAHAEQALGQHQVEDQGEVDQEGHHPEHGDLVRQVVDLVGQAKRGDDHGEVLAPALDQPQPDALDDLDHRVRAEPDRDVAQLPGVHRESLVEQAEQLGVIHAEAEITQQCPQRWQCLIVGLLKGEPGYREAPHRDGQRGEDQRPDEPLDREDAQDERAAYLFGAPHPGRAGRRAAGGGLPDDKGAAAQAAPGLALRHGDSEPVAQPGLVGGERDMPPGATAQQAPVHVRQPNSSRAWR